VIANYANANAGEVSADLTGAGATHASVSTILDRGNGPVPPGTAATSGPFDSPTRRDAGPPAMGLGVAAGVSVAVGVAWTWMRRRRRVPAIPG
jgi:hypothetical protein